MPTKSSTWSLNLSSFITYLYVPPYAQKWLAICCMRFASLVLASSCPCRFNSTNFFLPVAIQSLLQSPPSTGPVANLPANPKRASPSRIQWVQLNLFAGAATPLATVWYLVQASGALTGRSTETTTSTVGPGVAGAHALAVGFRVFIRRTPSTLQRIGKSSQNQILKQKHYSGSEVQTGWPAPICTYTMYTGMYTQQDVCCPESGYSYLDLKPLLETFEESSGEHRDEAEMLSQRWFQHLSW